MAWQRRCRRARWRPPGASSAGPASCWASLVSGRVPQRLRMGSSSSGAGQRGSHHAAPSAPCPAVLANGAGGTRELAAVLLAKLPASVWKVLPVRCGAALVWWVAPAAARPPPPHVPPTHLPAASHAAVPPSSSKAGPPTAWSCQSWLCPPTWQAGWDICGRRAAAPPMRTLERTSCDGRFTCLARSQCVCGRCNVAGLAHQGGQGTPLQLDVWSAECRGDGGYRPNVIARETVVPIASAPVAWPCTAWGPASQRSSAKVGSCHSPPSGGGIWGRKSCINCMPGSAGAGAVKHRVGRAARPPPLGSCRTRARGVAGPGPPSGSHLVRLAAATTLSLPALPGPAGLPTNWAQALICARMLSSRLWSFSCC